MGSNVPPMIPTRPPATERAYPGPSEPAPEDRLRPADGGPGPKAGARRTGRPAPPCSRSQSGIRAISVGRGQASDHVGTALSTREFRFGYGVAPKLWATCGRHHAASTSRPVDMAIRALQRVVTK